MGAANTACGLVGEGMGFRLSISKRLPDGWTNERWTVEGNVDKRDKTRTKCELVVSRLCLHLCLRLCLHGNVDKPGTFPLDGRVVTMARPDRVDHSCSFSQAGESQLAGYQPGCRSKSSSTSGGDEGNTGNGTRFRGGCERPRSSAGRGSGLVLMGEVTKEGQLDKHKADRETPPATRRSRRALEYLIIYKPQIADRSPPYQSIVVPAR